MTARREFIKNSVLGASVMASTKKYLWTDQIEGEDKPALIAEWLGMTVIG